MRTVLITGFEPFGGDARNPSSEIARALDGRIIRGRRIVGSELACVFGRCRRQLHALIDRHRPELIVCLGLAPNRTEITPERVALNLDDARIPDNAKQQPIDRAIVRGGPSAYWSSLPVKAIVAALRRKRIPASVSHTAGTFVCNHVFYGLMHDLQRDRRTRGGFIHVPWPRDWRGAHASAIRFEQMVRAIEAAVEVSLHHRHDAKTRGGMIA